MVSLLVPLRESIEKDGALSPSFTPLPSPAPEAFSEVGVLAAGLSPPPQPAIPTPRARDTASQERGIRMRMGASLQRSTRSWPGVARDRPGLSSRPLFD